MVPLDLLYYLVSRYSRVEAVKTLFMEWASPEPKLCHEDKVQLRGLVDRDNNVPKGSLQELFDYLGV
jgi:hypothetical protein